MFDFFSKRVFLATLALLAPFSIAGGGLAQQQEYDDVFPDIHQVGDCRTFELKNGLQVVVIENHRAPIVTQMVWYRAGAADEPKGRTGIAHFLEHLMFKGTSTYAGGEFSKFIAKVGGIENAFTSYDYTAYYQSVAPQYLETIMRFEADRMKNLVLTDEVIEPERNVIIEERRMRVDNNPAAILAEETQATLFLNSPYHNPVIGWRQEMEQLSRDDAIKFYQQFYTPNNATLIISGDVTAEKVRYLAMASYGKLEPTVDIGPRVRPQEPSQNTARTVRLNDPRVSQPSFQKNWVVPSYHTANKDNHEAEALALLGEILGGSKRSRLYQQLAVANNRAASVEAHYSGMAWDEGIFSVEGMPLDGVALDSLQTDVDQQIADIQQNGVHEAELSQVKKRFMKELVFSLDSSSGLANIYGSALSVGRSLQDISAWSERVQAVTTADVQAVAQRYLRADRGVSSYLLPPPSDGNNVEMMKEN